MGLLDVPFHAPLAHEQHCLVVDGTVFGQLLDARMILRPWQRYRWAITLIFESCIVQEAER